MRAPAHPPLLKSNDSAVGRSACGGQFPGVRCAAVAAAAILLAAGAPATRGEQTPPPAVPPYVIVRPDGTLQRNGRPWRGIGINYVDAFQRTLLRPGDTSCDQGFKTLAARGIPFARFMACGFWPADMRLYLEDRAAYFRALDAVVASAEKHGVGLVASLFWHVSTVPDMVGEPCSQWGNTSSRTHEFMRTYVADVVTRYRSRPGVWGWEFGNEYNLRTDLPNAASHRPPVSVRLGTPAARSERDDLTSDHVRTALAAFGREVRRHDPYRFITSGHATPRPSAWHQRAEGTWAADTPEQFAEVLLGDHPDPLTVISVRCYAGDIVRLALAAEVAARAGRMLFIGEFGAPGTGPQAEAEFRRTLEAVEKSGAPLAALWVFDYPAQSEWNVTATGPRSWQLKEVAEANSRLGTAACR